MPHAVDEQQHSAGTTTAREPQRRRPAFPWPHARAIASGDPRSNSHLRALDGLRGLAVLLVLVHHVNYSFGMQTMLPAGAARSALTFAVANGWLGVDVFFVLSGFLITSILLKSRDATNYYGAFFMRRLLRIGPLYYLVLAVAFFLPWPNSVTPTHAPPGLQMWWWLNASNLPITVAPYARPVMSVFWSLAVEEQFYLVWPVVARRVSRRTLLALALGGAAAVPVVRVLPWTLRLTAHYPLAIYCQTPLHCEGLLLGAALALLLAGGMLKAKALPWLRLGAGVAMAGTVVLLRQGFGFYATPMMALGAAAVVGWIALRGGRGVLSRVLGWAPLRLAGRYSYAMYVTQTLLLTWVTEHLLQVWLPGVGVARLLWCYGAPVVLSFALGACSWWAFDGRINRLKRLFPYRFARTGTTAGSEGERISPPDATMAA